jgi:hypothetical protein
MVFLYPQVSRYDFLFFGALGPGLGNMLFPWARSVSLGARYHLPVLFPTWPQIKLGSYWRGERDKRHYARLFRPTPDYVTGWQRLRLLLASPSISEEEFLQDPHAHMNSSRDVVVRVTGLGSFFLPILHDHDIIRAKLLDMVRPEHVPPPCTRGFVAAHVRLGDFTVGKQTTSMAFFENVLSQIKRNLPDEDIVIFTDGEETEVENLIHTYGARLARYGSSITDMLALSSAKLLVASKNSSFSWWASYLGRMPTIRPKETSTFSIYGDSEVELFLEDDSEIAQSFFSLLHETGSSVQSSHVLPTLERGAAGRMGGI